MPSDFSRRGVPYEAPSYFEHQKGYAAFFNFLQRQNIPQTVFMSVQGAENNSLVPHNKIEGYLQSLGIAHSLVRPSFFMQNLSTTHLSEIRDHGQLFIPAGKGKTNFIDVQDIASCVVRIFLDKSFHNKAYTLTGSRSYSYLEIAEQLSAVLGKTIEYSNPGALKFLLHQRKKRPLGMSLVMLALYTVVKMGKADISTQDTQMILGRVPKELKAFLQENRHLFISE